MSKIKSCFNKVLKVLSHALRFSTYPRIDAYANNKCQINACAKFKRTLCW